MIGSCELKARVEESLGTVLDPDFFGQAEQYARRKLDMCNERAGRIYGEDGYGDEYLVLLTADTVREMAFSAWCEIRNAEITAAREKAVERADAGLPGPIHADEEDRVVRCDCYEPIPEEGEPS